MPISYIYNIALFFGVRSGEFTIVILTIA